MPEPTSYTYAISQTETRRVITHPCGCQQILDDAARRVTTAITALDCQRRPLTGHPRLMFYVDKP